MEFTQYGGVKPKKRPAKKTTTKKKTKKGGNFLGSVSELFVPTGWENFATAAGLLALDRADAALRRGRNSTKKSNKQRGGTDTDSHMTDTEHKTEMDKYFSTNSDPGTEEIYGSMSDNMVGSMSGGGKKKPAKKKPTKKKPATKKKPTKKKPAKK